MAHGVRIAGNRKTKAEDWVLLHLVCYSLFEETESTLRNQRTNTETWDELDGLLRYLSPFGCYDEIP